MENAPDAILDIVRGLTTVASFMVVGAQVRDLWRQIYQSECSKCRGTGMITCPFCRGTATLRLTPARPLALLSRFHRSAADTYRCFHCGDETKHDNDLNLYEDDEAGTLQIIDNFKYAMGNKTHKVHNYAPTAGCVRCPSCRGTKVIERVTPAWDQVLATGPPWWVPILRRRAPRADPEVVPPFMEYPSVPPRPLIADLGGNDAEVAAEFKSGAQGTVSSSDAYRLEDYILPYIEDD